MLSGKNSIIEETNLRMGVGYETNDKLTLGFISLILSINFNTLTLISSWATLIKSNANFINVFWSSEPFNISSFINLLKLDAWSNELIIRKKSLAPIVIVIKFASWIFLIRRFLNSSKLPKRLKVVLYKLSEFLNNGLVDS